MLGIYVSFIILDYMKYALTVFGIIYNHTFLDEKALFGKL